MDIIRNTTCQLRDSRFVVYCRLSLLCLCVTAAYGLSHIIASSSTAQKEGDYLLTCLLTTYTIYTMLNKKIDIMSWEFCVQDGGVSEGFTHKMAACEFCLQDGGVSGSFTHKMAAWEICLQDGGVSDSLTHKMAAWEFCLQDGGVSESLEYMLRLQCRIYLVNVT